MANTVKRLFSANFILKWPIQFILIKALRVLKSLERRKIPVQYWNTMYILASSYQYYFSQTVLGYIALEKQIQQHFSKCESNLKERETSGERRCKERVCCAPFFNWYIDFWRQFFGTICFLKDSSPPLLFWHDPLLWIKIVKNGKLCDHSLEQEEKIINYWYSQITGQTLFNMAILE